MISDRSTLHHKFADSEEEMVGALDTYEDLANDICSEMNRLGCRTAYEEGDHGERDVYTIYFGEPDKRHLCVAVRASSLYSLYKILRMIREAGTTDVQGRSTEQSNGVE